MMGGLFGPDPNAVPFNAIPGYHPTLKHWVVEFQIGVTPFWQVKFPHYTEREIDFEIRYEMRRIALEMFAQELQRRLLGEDA